MSKINCQFKIKDLYAIKHALQNSVEYMKKSSGENWILTDNLREQYQKDIEHENKIIEYVTDEINKICGEKEVKNNNE